MIKLVALIRRHPDMDATTFRAYWEDVHAPLVRERLPGLVHYSGKFPLQGRTGPVFLDGWDYDAIVELGFPDRATMEANLGSPGFLAQDRQDSSARFMDEANSRSMMVEEIDAL